MLQSSKQSDFEQYMFHAARTEQWQVVFSASSQYLFSFEIINSGKQQQL